MNQEDKARIWGCIVGAIGLILGFIVGFLFDPLMEEATGIIVRRGFTTDMKAGLLKAFIGGAIGLVGGWFLGAYLGKGKDDKEQ